MIPLQLPRLVIAPMAGGPSTPTLVAAVTEAGAFGFIAAAFLTPPQLREAIRLVRAETSKPFGVNLFLPNPDIQLSARQVEAAGRALDSWRRHFGLPDPGLSPPYHPDFDEQLEVILDERPHIASFTFGIPSRETIRACHERGIATMGMVTSLSEARQLEDGGIDGIIAQGHAAGGHRAMFDATGRDPRTDVADLVSQLRGVIKVPIVAAGGIMDGRGMKDVIDAGAGSALLGTAFLLCPEAGTSAPYRQAVLDAVSRPHPGETTGQTRVFSGRLARGISNRFQLEMEQDPAGTLPYPAQNAYTMDIKAASALAGSSEAISLWAGKGIGRIREMGARELVRTLYAELDDAGA